MDTMAHSMPLDVELDEEERELERQILVLERKAKLRQRLRELRAAEDNHVGISRKDPGEHHVLGIDPEPHDALQEAIKTQPRTDKFTDRTETVGPPLPLPLRPSPAANLPPPLAPSPAKGSPAFWSLTVFGLLGIAVPGSSKRSTTSVVGVAINAMLDPTFYSVGGESMMMVSDGIGCTCSYSLTGVGSNMGPLLFQPRSSRVASPVSSLAVRISAVYAGHDARLATLGKKIPGSNPKAELGAVERPILLKPKPHFTCEDQQRSTFRDPKSLWWSNVDEVDSDGRSHGSQGQSSRSNSNRGNSETFLPWRNFYPRNIGTLLPWGEFYPGDHKFEDIYYKPELTDGEATVEVTKGPTRVAKKGKSSQKKPVQVTYIHIRIELLADLDDGGWTKVAHRKSARLTIRTGGSKDPSTWRAGDGEE